MQTVIYVDVLLAVNLLLTYILLVLTCTAMKTYVSSSRLLLGSLLGSFYSFVVLAPDIGFALSFLMKLFMCITLICITFKLCNLKLIIRYSLCFFAMNAVFGGLIMLMQYSLQSSVLIYKNATVYANISLPLLLVLSAVCYVIIKIILRFFDGRTSTQIMRVRIYIDGMCVETTAIADSGNSLTDPVSGKPINVASYQAVKMLLPSEVSSFIQGNYDCLDEVDIKWKSRISVSYADFAVGKSMLPVIRADSIVIIQNHKKHRYENCLIAVTMKEFSDSDYQMLLHPSLTDGEFVFREGRDEKETIH